jgi:hypothetical protein
MPSLLQKDKSELMTINGQIVAVDPRTNVAGYPIFGEEELAPSDYRIIRNSRNGLTTTIDISLATGRAAIDAANAANAEAGTTVFTVHTMPSDSTPQAKAFQVGSDTVLSYDGGRTYVSPDGQIRSMPADGVVPLSDTIAYEVMRAEQIRAGSGNQLAELDERLGLTMRGGDRDNPTSISSADAGLVRDALQAARRGTGPWSGIGALVDNVAGGMIPNQAIRTYFQNNQENRQFLRGVTILGRSALVVNPRFPVAEMERVGALFPDPDVFFRNPESEALKLIELKSLVMSQYRANLAALNKVFGSRLLCRRFRPITLKLNACLVCFKLFLTARTKVGRTPLLWRACVQPSAGGNRRGRRNRNPRTCPRSSSRRSRKSRRQHFTWAGPCAYRANDRSCACAASGACACTVATA